MFFVVVGGWVTFLILSPLLQLASVASIKEVASTPPSWNCQVPKVSQPIRAVLVSIDQSEQLSRVNQPIKVVLMSIDQSEQLSLVNRPIRAALTSIDKSEQFFHISRVVELPILTGSGYRLRFRLPAPDNKICSTQVLVKNAVLKTKV